MPKREHETDIFIETEPGKVLRLRVTVIEEGLPTPMEAHAMRAPNAEEAVRLALHCQALGKVSLKRPF